MKKILKKNKNSIIRLIVLIVLSFVISTFIPTSQFLKPPYWWLNLAIYVVFAFVSWGLFGIYKRNNNLQDKSYQYAQGIVFILIFSLISLWLSTVYLKFLIEYI